MQPPFGLHRWPFLCSSSLRRSRLSDCTQIHGELLRRGLAARCHCVSACYVLVLFAVSHSQSLRAASHREPFLVPLEYPLGQVGCVPHESIWEDVLALVRVGNDRHWRHIIHLRVQVANMKAVLLVRLTQSILLLAALGAFHLIQARPNAVLLPQEALRAKLVV